jgi:hypothetical protein
MRTSIRSPNFEETIVIGNVTVKILSDCVVLSVSGFPTSYGFSSPSYYLHTISEGVYTFMK